LERTIKSGRYTPQLCHAAVSQSATGYTKADKRPGFDSTIAHITAIQLKHLVTMFSLEIFCLLLGVSLSWADLPANFDKKTAKEKQEYQWQQIVESKYDLNYLPTKFPAPDANLSLLINPVYLTQKFTW
jgi:hypothetical protein